MDAYSNDRSRRDRVPHGVIVGYSKERSCSKKEASAIGVDWFEISLYALMIVLVLLANFA